MSTRKHQIVVLFERMREYQPDKIMENPDAPIPDDVRIIKDDDLDVEQVVCANTPEELKDIHNHFLLYHGHEIPAMREAWKKKEKQKRRIERIEKRRREMDNLEEGAEPPPPISDEEEFEKIEDEHLKLKMDSGPYLMCRKAGLAGLAKKFGLKSEHYAENLRDSYQRHEVEQEQTDPYEVAKQYILPKFTNEEEILYAAKFMIARQIAREPLLRKTVRELFFERAKISVYPTKKHQRNR